MRNTVWIGLFALLLSCNDGITRIPEPDNLIQQDKMVEVLADLIKLEEHIKSKYVSVNQFHKVMVNSGDSLFVSHGVTFEEFDQSMEYYGSRQDVMQDIYSAALEQLNQELGELQSGQ